VSRRLVIVGAGPMGLSAADAALRRGFEVTVLEQGRVGEALERWGPVRCFTPVSMNFPAALLDAAGVTMARDSYLSGPELRRQILEPIVANTHLRDRVHPGCRVVAIARRGMTRTDYAGHPLRAERPFLLQTESAAGERSFEAELVFDATGGYALANAFGSGGAPARGERAVEGAVIRDHATLGARLAQLGGRRLLLIGHGHSAANALLMLEGYGVEVVWAVRIANRRPCQEMANDPLPERARVVTGANDLAADPPSWLRVERRATVEAVERQPDGALMVRISGGREVPVDAIASFTGFRPDSRHLAELPVEISPVSEGGARLYRAIANITDCLSVPTVRSADLQSGEPGFYFIGSRSYGRSRTFLLQTGLAQMEQIVASL
jgi:thioredoxin reductase